MSLRTKCYIMFYYSVMCQLFHFCCFWLYNDIDFDEKVRVWRWKYFGTNVLLAIHAIWGRGFNSPAVFSFVINTPCQLYDELKSCIYTINIVFKYSRCSANCLPKERSIQNVIQGVYLLNLSLGKKDKYSKFIVWKVAELFFLIGKKNFH